MESGVAGGPEGLAGPELEPGEPELSGVGPGGAPAQTAAHVHAGAAARTEAAPLSGGPVLRAETGTGPGVLWGRWVLVGGRLALAVLAVAWLPGFLTAMATILAAGGP